jgi:hypothetical protein
MPQQADHAARQRDRRLARTRRASLWVASGAAAASLGLATAFAHDLPGHRSAASTPPGAPAHAAQPASTPRPGRQPEVTKPSSAPPTGGSAAVSHQTPPAQRSSGGAAAGPSPAPTHLAQPRQAPATTPAPAQTTSGGS